MLDKFSLLWYNKGTKKREVQVMITVLICVGALVGLTAVGFLGCWLRWNVAPAIKDKIKEKKLKKLEKNVKKRLTK